MMPKRTEPLVQTHQQIVFFPGLAEGAILHILPKRWTVVDRGYKKFTTFLCRNRLTPFLPGHFESLISRVI